MLKLLKTLQTKPYTKDKTRKNIYNIRNRLWTIVFLFTKNYIGNISNKLKDCQKKINRAFSNNQTKK